LLLGTNLTGTIVFVAAFSIAMALGSVTGIGSEGIQTSFGGLLVVGLTVLYSRLRTGRWLSEIGEGSAILFLPAWAIGIFWSAFGVYKVIEKHVWG